MNAMRDSLSDLATSDDGEDGEHQDDDQEDIGHGTLTEDHEPGCMMGTISNMQQHCMDSFRQKQMRLDKQIQPGWVDAADYFHERDM
jgi:hypothetical protein